MATTGARLRALHRRLPDASVLNLTYAFTADGPLSFAAFASALQELVIRCPALGGKDTAPAYVRRPDLCTLVDLVDESGERQSHAVLASVAVERRTPFALPHSPGVRARIIRLACERHVLVLVFHHAVADAWSLARYARELGALYGMAARAEPLPPPSGVRASAPRADEPPAASTAATELLRETLRGVDRRQVDPFTDAPEDDAGVWRRVTTFDSGFFEQLRDAARARRRTIFTVFAAAAARAVGEIYGLPAVVLGTSVLNRAPSAVLAAEGAHYQGALLHVCAASFDEALRSASAGISRTVTRRLAYEEQKRVLASEIGARSPIEPALFVFGDRHPLENLLLSGIVLHYLAEPDGVDDHPSPVHSLLCGRIALFLRECAAAATLNAFSRRGSVPEACALAERVVAVLERLVGRSNPAGETPLPWFGALSKRCVPLVDALSPVAL